MITTESSKPRILVVEDEIMIRMLATDLLGDIGFDVDEAGSAGEALAIIRDREGAFQAVVVDVGLPDRRGDELAEELRALWPTLPLLIATGYGEGDYMARFAGDSRIAVIGKPYDGDALREALTRISAVSVSETAAIDTGAG